MANTALKLNGGRQWPLVAEQVITFANINDTAVAVPAVKLPPGAVVVGGALMIDTPFNSTTNVVAIGDATVTNRYGSAIDLKAAAGTRTALTLTSYVSDGAPILVTPTSTGAAPTAGSVRLQVQYVIAGRANEVQP